MPISFQKHDSIEKFSPLLEQINSTIYHIEIFVLLPVFIESYENWISRPNLCRASLWGFKWADVAHHVTNMSQYVMSGISIRFKVSYN